jgi:hypothetical protein
VDQAAPAAAGLLWPQPKRRAVSDVVGNMCLSDGSDYEEGTGIQKSLYEIL